MSEQFDPYHRWLGIAPEHRPPSHYQLLGIPQFESDLDVIESAADRQMKHVRTFQSGKHVAHSQQILGELSAAKICLLNGDKKEAYDTELKNSLGPVAAAPPPKVAKPPTQRMAKPPTQRVAKPPTQRATPPPPPATTPAPPAPPPPPPQEMQDSGQVALGELFAQTDPASPSPGPTKGRQRKRGGGCVMFASSALILAIVVAIAVFALLPKSGTLKLTIKNRESVDIVLAIDGHEQEVDLENLEFDLSHGEHAVAITSPGYEDFEEVVEIVAGKNAEVDVKLDRLATIEIKIESESMSGLKLQLDGNELTVPSSGELTVASPKGKHTITASNGETDYSKEFFLVAGQSIDIPVVFVSDKLLIGTWRGQVELDEEAVATKLKQFGNNLLQKFAAKQAIDFVRSGSLQAKFEQNGTYRVLINLAALPIKQQGKWTVAHKSGSVWGIQFEREGGQIEVHEMTIESDDSFTINLPGDSAGLGVFRCTRVSD